jgi:hypothetical protein
MPLPERHILIESSGTKSLNGCYPTNALLHQIPPQRMMTAIRRGEQRPTGSRKQRLTVSGRNRITGSGRYCLALKKAELTAGNSIAFP